MLLHRSFSHLEVHYQNLPESDPSYVITWSTGRPHNDNITLILTMHEMADLLRAIDEANEQAKHSNRHLN